MIQPYLHALPLHPSPVGPDLIVFIAKLSLACIHLTRALTKLYIDSAESLHHGLTV